MFYATLGAWLLIGCGVVGISCLSESLSVVGLLLAYSVQSNVQMLMTALFGVAGCWIKVYIFIAFVLLWAGGLLEGIGAVFLTFAVNMIIFVAALSHWLACGGLGRIWRVGSSGVSGSSRMTDYHGLAGHNALLAVVCASWLGLAVTVSGLLKLFFGLDGWCVLMTLFLGIPMLMVALGIIYVLLLVASLDCYAVALVVCAAASELSGVSTVLVASLLVLLVAFSRSPRSWTFGSSAFHRDGMSLVSATLWFFSTASRAACRRSSSCSSQPWCSRSARVRGASSASSSWSASPCTASSSRTA